MGNFECHFIKYFFQEFRKYKQIYKNKSKSYIPNYSKIVNINTRYINNKTIP